MSDAFLRAIQGCFRDGNTPKGTRVNWCNALAKPEVADGLDQMRDMLRHLCAVQGDQWLSAVFATMLQLHNQGTGLTKSIVQFALIGFCDAVRERDVHKAIKWLESQPDFMVSESLRAALNALKASVWKDGDES